MDKKIVTFLHLRIHYIYDATGAKLKKIVTEGSSLGWSV